VSEIIQLPGTRPLDEQVILDFVKRERVVSTQNVAYRFGWSVPDARKVMQRLYMLGRVGRTLVTNDYGTVYDWMMPAPEKGQ
jgi:hypothetical protein